VASSPETPFFQEMFLVCAFNFVPFGLCCVLGPHLSCLAFYHDGECGRLPAVLCFFVWELSLEKVLCVLGSIDFAKPKDGFRRHFCSSETLGTDDTIVGCDSQGHSEHSLAAAHRPVILTDIIIVKASCLLQKYFPLNFVFFLAPTTSFIFYC
jgi:hypothetical protein